jgi:putative metallohydrolase (TIGR04338 family)
MAKSDDPLKSKVYDAEFEVRFILRQGAGTFTDFYGSTLMIPEQKKFGDIPSVERYIRQVCELDWVRDRWSFAKNPPHVRPRKGNSFAHYERLNNMIAVPPHDGSDHSWAMNELVVLHELAHHFTSVSGHTTQFCLNLMDLWGEIIDPTVKLLFMRALDKRGVPLA